MTHTYYNNNNRKKTTHLSTIIIAIATMLTTTTCTDDLTPTYSQKHPVRCDLMIMQYTELNNVIGNFGQFATIRQSGNKLVMQNTSTKTNYDMTAEQGRYFTLGLGGLIIGTNYEGELRAYDLSCPNCERTERRLTINDNGIAQCAATNCHLKYDLNHDGAITEKPTECIHTSPRSLFRYHITYDGLNLHIYN